MKKVNKVFLIIAGICGLLGAILVLIGVLMGADNGFGINTKGQPVNYADAKRYNLPKTKIEKPVTDIDATISYGNIYIKASDDYYIEYNCVGNEIVNGPTYEVVDGKLIFKEPQYDVNNDNVFFSFDFDFFDDVDDIEDNYVKIYVPTGTVINGITIEDNCGDITLSGLECENIDVTNDYGDIELDNINATNLNLINSCGDVDVTNSQFGNGNIELEYGSVNIESTTIDVVKIDNACGDIETDSLTSKNIEVSDDCGDIELHLLGDISQYDYEVDTDLGDVVFNDTAVESSSTKSEGAEYKLQVKNSCGDINISFQK